MAEQRTDWAAIVKSIKRRRSPEARFFKPVCVIAAIDLAAGRPDPVSLDYFAIEHRFAEYIEPFFPNRAHLGWQPLWHVSNDKLWTFHKQGRPLGPRAFEHGKPGTRSKLYSRVDRLTLNPQLISLWSSADGRRVLRDQMLRILHDDYDPDCRRLAPPLFDPANLNAPERWPSPEELNRYLAAARDQLELFDDLPPTPRAPKKQRPSPRDQLLAFDAKRLPKESPFGPAFRATGRGPIGLAPERAPRITEDQAEFHAGLLAKTRRLLTTAEAGRNRTAVVREATEAFFAALGASPDQVRVRLLWMHGNTLRRLNDADIRIRKNPDPDEVPLPETVGELLGDLVQQFNVYAMGDDVLCELDRNSLGPGGRAEVLIELEAGRRLVGAIRNEPGIMDRAATEVLVAAADSAERASNEIGPNADQALANALEVERNGGLAILRSALVEAKNSGKAMKEGALREAGATLAQKLVFAPFVAAYQAHLVPLLSRISGSEVVQQLIELIKKVTSPG